MDLILYRIDQNEKCINVLTEHVGRIEQSLGDIKLSLAGAPTKHTIAGWAIAVIVAIVAVGGLLMQSSSNQLAAFQAGLAAVQTAVSAVVPAPPPLGKR